MPDLMSSSGKAIINFCDSAWWQLFIASFVGGLVFALGSACAELAWRVGLASPR